MNELINDEGVCRTATATPGLLIMQFTIQIKRSYGKTTHFCFELHTDFQDF